MLLCGGESPHCAAVALCLEAGMLQAAHAWLLMSGALDSNRQPCLLWTQSVISHESKETAGKHELD